MVLSISTLGGCGGADEEQLGKIAPFMEQICRFESGDQDALAQVDLVEAAKPFAPVPFGTIVAVTPTGVALDGSTVVDIASTPTKRQLTAAVYGSLHDTARERAQLQLRDPTRGPKPLVLALARDVPAWVVHGVLEGLFQLEHRRILLALRPMSAPEVPPPPSRLLDDELRRVPDDQLPLVGANKLTAQAADCPPLAELFGALAFAPPEARCEVLSKGLVEAFSRSSCKADVDQVLTLVHAMTVPRKPILVLPVVLHPDTPGIPAKPEQPWGEVAQAFFKRGGERLWLELAAP
jgi:hypothetical protein